jgi:hypothetical protein
VQPAAARREDLRWSLHAELRAARVRHRPRTPASSPPPDIRIRSLTFVRLLYLTLQPAANQAAGSSASPASSPSSSSASAAALYGNELSSQLQPSVPKDFQLYLHLVELVHVLFLPAFPSSAAATPSAAGSPQAASAYTALCRPRLATACSSCRAGFWLTVPVHLHRRASFQRLLSSPLLQPRSARCRHHDPGPTWDGTAQSCLDWSAAGLRREQERRKKVQLRNNTMWIALLAVPFALYVFDEPKQVLMSMVLTVLNIILSFEQSEKAQLDGYLVALLCLRERDEAAATNRNAVVVATAVGQRGE